MKQQLNILLINKEKQSNFHKVINENILEATNLEDSMKYIINQTINVIIIFLTPQIATSSGFINYLDFVNLNFCQDEKYYIFITSHQSKISKKLYNMSNTYFFNQENECEFLYNKIKKQISLIKKNIFLSLSQNYYDEILHKNKHSLILGYTLNSIHALIKENLNILSVKNGRHFLNTQLKTDTTPEYCNLENELLYISQQINTLDKFLNEKNNHNLKNFINSLEPILELYYHTYNFSYTTKFQLLKVHCISQHTYTIMSLLFIHIVNQEFTHTQNITIKINTSEINKQLLISLLFKVECEIIFSNSIYINLAKIISMKNSQTLNIQEQKQGYTFSIFQ